jgi:hypothetical protein
MANCTTSGELLTRPVDQHGNVLDIGPESPQREGGQALIPQAAEGLVLFAQGDRDG